MKKRILAVFMAFTMILTLFAACGSPASESNGSNPSSESGKKDAVTINLALSQAEHTDDLINYIAKFEEEENIKVNVESITESGYIQKLLLGLSSEQPDYDVFMASNSMWGQLLDSGWAQPLDKFLDDPTLTDPAWKDGFSQSMLDVLMRDGERYAVVYQMGTNILYYNKAIFKEYGLDPEKPPKTMAEVLEVAKKLNHPEKDQYGISFRASREQNVNTFLWVMLWFTLGGDWYNIPGSPDIAVLDRQEAIKATEYFAEFHKYAPQGIANYGFEDAMLAMQQGKVAMWIDTSILAGNLLDPNTSKISGDVGFSAFEEGRAIGSPWTFMMAKKSAHQNEAWKLMQYLTGYDVTWEQTKKGVQTSPVRKDVLSNPEINTYLNAELAAALSKGLENAAPVYFPTISQTAEIRSILAIAISDVASGKRTSEQAMNDTNQEVIKILKRDGFM